MWQSTWILWTTQVAHQQCSTEIKHPWLEALRILTSSMWLPDVVCGAAFLACAESRAGSLDIELYLWLSDASFGISLESARPYLFWWCGRMSQGECESSHSFPFSNGSVSSDIDVRWQLLVNCRTPWTNSCQSDSRLVKHARTKAYLAQKGVPRNAVSIELASQKKAWKFAMDFSQDFCRKARHIGHLPRPKLCQKWLVP